MRRSALIIGFLICCFSTAQASDKTFPPVTLPFTQVRLLKSTTNNVGYKLYISVPNDYHVTEERYPVVYMLDADYSFVICRNIVEHLSDRHHLTKAILVGIAYDGPDAYRMNRTRDYTPTHVADCGYGPEYQKVSGGAPAFLSFIRDELIPYMKGEFRTNGTRVLVGHSYGGLFTVWVSLTATDLFAGYIMVSPSLWYDDKLLFQIEAERAERTRSFPVRMYCIVGDHEVNGTYDMVGDLERFVQTLQRRNYKGLHLKWEVAKNETHNSVFPRGLSNGLRFVLEGR